MKTTIGFGLVAALAAAACGPGPVRTATLPDERARHPQAPAIGAHREMADDPGADPTAIAQLRDLNARAGRPRFGVIGAYYQLPVARPAGASLVRGDVLGLPYEQTRIETDVERPWAVAPVPAAQAEALAATLNSLLDAGVQWTDVSMADAARLMQAEQQAASSNSLASFNTMTPSGVDLLVSLQQGRGVAGPIYVGRVVRTRDGALLALATQPDAGPYTLRRLVWQLVLQGLERQAADAPTGG